MKNAVVSLIAVAAFVPAAFAGTEYSGKNFKQVTQTVAPQECFYGENEWNVSLWGTYAFTGTDSNGVGAREFFLGENHGDRYLETDHAWGGGGDIKYFWHKYFGFGVEGYVLDAKRTSFDFEGAPLPGGFTFTKDDDSRAIGAVLGTFTLRYPIGCTRFAPYAFGGGGVIFGGGERDRIQLASPLLTPTFTTHHTDGEGRAIGQFGGGFEVRITRHIGWINDFSWNVVDGSKNNFGMARTGINFAF